MKTKTFGGVAFKIDRPKGTVKEWPQKDGSVKRFTYETDYGYLPKHTGEDDEGLDFFVGSDPHGHLESFQKLRRDDSDGRLHLDETKFLVGVTDRERETIYRLYGPEVWHRRVYRDMAHVMRAAEKFKGSKKMRYAVLQDKVASPQGVLGRLEQGVARAANKVQMWTPSAAQRLEAVNALRTPKPHFMPPRAPQAATAPSKMREVIPHLTNLPDEGPMLRHQAGPNFSRPPELPDLRNRATEVFPGEAVTPSLGSVLWDSPEGAFLNANKQFHHLAKPENLEQLDALGYHMMKHQQAGGSIDAESAQRALSSPEFWQTVRHFKGASLRIREDVYARYGLKLADMKFADIDKRIQGEVMTTSSDGINDLFNRVTAKTAGEKVALTPGALAGLGAGIGAGVGAVHGFRSDDPSSSVEHHILRGLLHGTAGAGAGAIGGYGLSRLVGKLAPHLVEAARNGPYPHARNGVMDPNDPHAALKGVAQMGYDAWMNPAVRFGSGALIGKGVANAAHNFVDDWRLQQYAAQRGQSERPQDPNAGWHESMRATRHMGPYSSSLDRSGGHGDHV